MRQSAFVPRIPIAASCLFALVLLCAAIASPERASAARPVHLGSGLASRTARFFLDKRFRDSYSNRAGGSINCKRGGPFNVKHCRVGWAIGDTSYGGSLRIALFQRRDGERYSIIRMRMVILDEYCAFVLHRQPSKCVKHKREVWHITYF
jgi:hypothetical protein